MPEAISYAQMLRPIGQLLEALGIESFSLTIEGSGIVVRGRQTMKPQEASSGLSLKGLWRLLRGSSDRSGLAEPSGMIELRYTPADIARLDAEGRTQRRSSAGAPEAHSLSQIFRAAGSFVDQKEGRLLAIRKEGPNIKLSYESASRTNIAEQFSVSELYDFWVKMYLKRGGRPASKY